MDNTLFQPDISNCKFQEGNAFELLNEVKDSSIDLTITSPPYNIGKVYEKRKELAIYLDDYVNFANVLYKKTNNRGHIFWEVENYIENGELLRASMKKTKRVSGKTEGNQQES